MPKKALASLSIDQRAAVDKEIAPIMEQLAASVPAANHAAVHAHCEELHDEVAAAQAEAERWKAYATLLATQLQQADMPVPAIDEGAG